MKKTLPLLVALLMGSAPVFAQNAAVVNGKAIPKARLDNLIKRSGQPETPELRDRARNMLIDRELLLQEANKRALPERDDVREQLDQARLSVLVGVLMEDYLKTHGPSEEDLKAQYEKIKDRIGGGGKEYRVRHILVEKETDAKALIAKIKGGANFEDVAKEASKDPGSAANGGDLDWANPQSFVPEFSQAMVSLEKGQMTESPVKSQFGYHIIRLDDVRETKAPTFEELKPQLTQMIESDQNWQRTKFSEMMQALRDKAKIQ